MDRRVFLSSLIFEVLKCGKKATWIRQTLLPHGSYNFRPKKISRAFQGFFKDKLQFLRTKIYVINHHSLTPFWSPYWLTPRMSQIFLEKQNNLILQKGVVGIDKVVNFKDSLRPNKEIEYFSRTLAEFKDLSRQLVKFNDLYKIIQTMLPLKKINTNLGGTRPLSTIPSPISLTCNFPPFWSKMRCYGKQITLQLIIVHKQSRMPHFLTKSLLNQTKNVMKTKKMINKWSFQVTCRLMGMCRWVGSYFHNWIDYNGPAFSLELLEWDCTFFGVWGSEN